MMADKYSIEITYLKGCFLFAVDLGYLVEDPLDATVVSYRVTGNWLSKIKEEFKDWDRFGFTKPEFSKSEYGKTDRATRNTFAKKHEKQLLPLELQIAQPVKYTEKEIFFFVESIRITPHGGISIRIPFEIELDARIRIETLVDHYNHVGLKLKSLVLDTLSSFAGFWNAASLDFDLHIPQSRDLEEVLYSYEVIDFDFHLRKGTEIKKVASIKALYTSDDMIPAYELAALARMSASSATALNDAKLNEFIETDIGGRDDELWTVSSERMVRCHPDRNSIYNRAFFDDVKLAAELLICQQATFDFLEEWVSSKRKDVLNQLTASKESRNITNDSFRREIRDVVLITQILVEPLELQKNVRHTFYIRTISRLINCLELHTSSEHASRSLTNFAQLIESIAGYNVAEMSAELSATQVSLAKSAERIAFISILIAIIGVAPVLVSIWPELEAILERLIAWSSQLLP